MFSFTEEGRKKEKKPLAFVWFIILLKHTLVPTNAAFA
jgi:hypothetical protein